MCNHFEIDTYVEKFGYFFKPKEGLPRDIVLSEMVLMAGLILAIGLDVNLFLLLLIYIRKILSVSLCM